MDRREINLISPINQLGYGVAGLNILKSLSNLADVSLWTIGNPDAPPEDHPVLRQSLQNALRPSFTAPCIRIWHQHDMGQFVGRGEKIGFPIFELDTFTDVERHHLSSLDRIFVCSEWAKDVCLNNNLKNKIDVIPLGVDQNIFKPKESSEEATIFFNCGKWEVRKGHDVLVSAFNKAFSEEDDVELWMMCSNPFYSPEENKEWENLYKNSKLGQRIKIIPRQESQQEVYNVMGQAHCGIFPSRAEGWNLELLEMMACGKTVIATNYSAHTEFCTPKNCLLVDLENSETAYDGKWFKGQGSWGKIDQKSVDVFADHMSSVHHLRKTGKLSPNEEGVETARNFSWNNTAKEIINAIST